VSGVVGVVHFDGTEVRPGLVEAMAEAAPHRGAGGTTMWLGRDATFASQRPGGEVARCHRPVERAGLVCLADARLDDRTTLCSALVDRGFVADETADDTELLLAAYRCWGRSCPEHLHGDYTFAVWNLRARQLFLARDPMGMRACYLRYEPRRRLLFATELKQLLAVPDIPVEIDELSMAANLCGPYLPPDRTMYAGIGQLPPGHALVVDASGSRSWRTWRPDPSQRLTLADPDAAAGYRERLEVAVRDRLQTSVPVGISLSGGLDSTSLAALAGSLHRQGRVATPELHAYAWGFREVAGADERHVSDQVLAAFPIDGHVVWGDDCWPLCDLDADAPDRDDPIRWPYQALIQRTAARARDDGVGLLLTGARGDELTGDWAFDELGLLASGRIAAGLQDVRSVARASGRPTARAAAGLVATSLEHRLPRLRQLRAGSEGDRVAPWPPWIPDALARRVGLGDLLAEARRLPSFDGRGRSVRYGRILVPQAARWAVHAERSAARLGMAAADPFADRRLAEFVLALPAWQVQRRTEPKRLAREAMRGVVPETARAAAAKNIPSQLYDRGLKERGAEAVDRLLEGSIAAAQGWLEPDEVSDAHARYRRGGGVSHDYWSVVTTEWWLRRWWS
jgi:asparagine synthase (glutamine-hydrolysing)